MKHLSVCLAALWLAACANTQEHAGSVSALGPPLERFTASGRISLRQGDRRDHVRFQWEHAPGRDVVLIMSPLGQGMAELSRDATGARLVQPNQDVITADTLPKLAQRVFGMALPLEDMADWLRGARPALGGDVAGWRVLVSDTAAIRQNRLVRLLEASREDVDFKLIVDDWELPE